MCNLNEVQEIKDALARNPNNIGVGILHEPTGRVFLKPFDQVTGGHAQFASLLRFPLREVRGFVIGRTSSGYQVVNQSHLNQLTGQGQPGSLAMPQDTFNQVLQSLNDAGL